MKTLFQFTIAVACLAFAASATFAQPPGGGRGGPPPGGGPGQAVLQALDTDGNHEISSVEMANASAALKTLDVNGDGKLSDEDERGAGQGQRRNRGQSRGQGQGGQNQRQGRGGPPQGEGGPPSPEQLVEKAMQFDADGDGKLDSSELLKFAQQMGPPPHEHGGQGGSNSRPQRPERN